MIYMIWHGGIWYQDVFSFFQSPCHSKSYKIICHFINIWFWISTSVTFSVWVADVTVYKIHRIYKQLYIYNIYILYIISFISIMLVMLVGHWKVYYGKCPQCLQAVPAFHDKKGGFAFCRSSPRHAQGDVFHCVFILYIWYCFICFTYVRFFHRCNTCN